MLGEGDVQQGCTDRVSGKACMLSSRVVHRVAHTQTHTQTHTHACSNSPPTLVVDLGLVTAELHAVQRSPRLGDMHVRETRKIAAHQHCARRPASYQGSSFKEIFTTQCACMCACACQCMHVCVHARECTCVRVNECAHPCPDTRPNPNTH